MQWPKEKNWQKGSTNTTHKTKDKKGRQTLHIKRKTKRVDKHYT